MEQHTGIELLTGGFPCQDISGAGKGRGIGGGSRSSLWYEMCATIETIRPKYVIIENVGNLPRKGLLEVLHSLAAIGYDAEWDCVSAAELGAPHTRKRYIIVAYPSNQRCNGGSGDREEGRILHNKIWTAEENKPEWSGWFCRFGSTFQANAWRILASKICGMDDGSTDRVDRIKALGNAVIPKKFEIIAARIKEI